MASFVPLKHAEIEILRGLSGRKNGKVIEKITKGNDIEGGSSTVGVTLQDNS